MSKITPDFCRAGAPSLPNILLALLLSASIGGCQRMAQPLPPMPVFDREDPPTTSTAQEPAVTTIADFVSFAGTTRVYFASGSAELSSEALAILDRQAQWLSGHPTVRATLAGHADEFGTREYKFALGAQRAAAMKFYFLSKGIDPERLATTSFGKQRPAVGGLAEASRQQDRRGETNLIGIPAGQ